MTRAHGPWIAELREKYEDFSEDTVNALIEEECGRVFVKVLEDAGVFKQNEEGFEGVKRFVEHCRS